jgi:transposase
LRRDAKREELEQLKETENQYYSLRAEYDRVMNQMKETEERLEFFRQQNMDLEKRLKQMETRSMELEERNMELESKMVNLMETLQTEMEKAEVKQQVVDNTLHLVSQLPQNSPYRRPLLSFFFQGLSQEDAQNIYGISTRTYKRVMNEDGNVLVEQKYKSEVTRKRISDEQLKEVKEILNQILPVQSGRDWRVQEMTDKKLYELYDTLAEGKPVSKSYFFYQILDKEKIHHSKKVKFCPLCERYPEDRDEEVLEHVQLFPIQRGAYLDDKQNIQSGKDSTTVLVTQDFTQLELEGSFVQDLILCKYSYNKDSKDKLDREYRHFIGEIGDKNGINFVTGAWLALVKANWFNGATVVKIWSDGGPKHFKISSNRKFLLALQHGFPEIEWIYNFFVSYHGCSICDGVAAHAKGKLNRTMRDSQTAIRTIPEAVETIGDLENHVASTVTLTSNDFSTRTLHGIKSFHKFTADKEKKVINAFETSQKIIPLKQFCPQDFIALEDMMT